MFTHRPRTVLPALLLAGLLAAAPAASASTRHAHATRAHAGRCANADLSASDASTKDMRAAVVCLLNRQRVAHHLPTLQSNWRLDNSAEGWTATLVRRGIFNHGSDFASRITAAGFDWSSAGENIATGYPTPRSVVSAWMASLDHCQNILDPSYSAVGTGLSRHPVVKFASGPSTWTQDFALPMGQQAPSGNWGPSHGCPYQV